MATLLDYPAPDYGPEATEAWGNKLIADDSGSVVQVRGLGRTAPRWTVKLGWTRAGTAIAAFTTALRALKGGFTNCYFYTPSFWEWWDNVAAGTGDGSSILFPFGGRSTQASPAPVVKLAGAVQTGNYAIAPAAGDSLMRDQVTFVPLTTWVNLGTPSAGAASIAHLVDCGGGKLLGFTASAYLVRSTDYGATWADLGRDPTSIGSSSAASLGTGIALAGENSNEGIYRTTDYGSTWTNLHVGTQIGHYADVLSLVSLGGGIALAGTQANTPTPYAEILRSTDSGVTWVLIGSPGSQSDIRALASLGSGIVVAGTYPGAKILRSTDSGATWTDLGRKQSGTGAGSIACFAYVGGGVVLAGTDYEGVDADSGEILRSTDYGATWTNLGRQFTCLKIHALVSIGSGVVLAGTDGGKILVSADSGATWADLGQQFSQAEILSLATPKAGIAVAGTNAGGLILRYLMGPIGAVTVSFLGRRLLLGRLSADPGPHGTPTYSQGTLSVELQGEEV